ncbi:MAG: TonB-dependent receptor [Pseudomonadota bacterium]
MDLLATLRSNDVRRLGWIVLVLMVPGLTLAQNEAGELEEIVVRGFQSSIENAIDIKRNSDTVEEAITAIDIGQFADDSIASAIQRIPGVQIETNDAGTDGDRVTIRGMGPQFVNSTINGRVLLSSGTQATNLRQMNFDVFPPNVLSGVRIAKMQTASRPESGLAGQVDLRTLRPLTDAPRLRDSQFFGSVSVRGEYQDVSEDYGNRINVILGGRNAGETVGAYLAAVTGDSEAARDQLRVNSASRNLRIDNDGDGVQDATLEGVLAPSIATYSPIREERGRTAVAGGLQFRPTSELDMLFDVSYSEFDNQSVRDRLQFQFNPTWGATVFDAAGVQVDENNTVRFVDYGQSTGGGPLRAVLGSLQFQNKTENLITGFNIDWVRGRLATNLDVYYSDVEYLQDLRNPQFRLTTSKPDIVYDATGRIPGVTAGADVFDSNSNWTFFRTTVREIHLDADNTGATLGFDYDLDNDSLAAVKFGLHFDETEVDVVWTPANQFANAAQGADIVAAALTGNTTPGSFLDGAGSPASWLTTDFGAMAAIDANFLTSGVEDLGVDPNASYISEERVMSGYLQLDMDTQLGGKPLTGNIGLRAVNTENRSVGNLRGVNPEPIPVTIENDYWEYLPSVNLKLLPTDTVALRLGISRTLTRPEFRQMAPITNVGAIPDPGEIGTATSGNPELDPIVSDNVDVTAEWYLDNGASFVASVFYKDVKDFIVEQITPEAEIPGLPGVYDITQPINFSDGTVRGAEIGFYLPLGGMNPSLEGFGISGNYTYVDSEFDEDVGDAGFGFPGASEDNFNFIAFYDADLFSARLAYVYRGSFFRQLAGTGAQGNSARFTEAQERLDLNVKLRPIRNLTVSLNAANLTNEDRRDYIGSEGTFLDYFLRGRTYSMTATYRF